MARLTVNNQAMEFRLEPDTPLLWALRDAANLTGTKYGCGTGECGACMVIVDGQAMPSCTLSLGEAEGRSVTTIEGLSPDRSHPVQQALVVEQAIQCGFCTPGLVMNAAALLARTADPTEQDIAAALTNICRCGVYPRLVRAVQRAGRILRREEPGVPLPTPATATTPGL
ncbi:(2Fe-2S)-binding protein [Novosphingobium sp. KCTC 2891]|uniref:(2Fe-2S)-binding protein n=1 Tax=Novosphingobium sp. KCTC 2891 TaxID=2989730 RepID=UPI002222AA0A|nr:(2Fe-2S)-binding protein [Novosphingobium sp. KCTC 2891]MCW1382380.1 (2Fe-2S)-binding protein [Novosphingobium sp. KCTC 2891]